MSESKVAIRPTFESNGLIQGDHVRAWIREAQDVETLAYLYRPAS
jgi:hypothetical protein